LSKLSRQVEFDGRVSFDPAHPEWQWQYLKARPLPGPEAAMAVKSDGQLRQLATNYGRLDAAICYDMDFPELMVQSGDQRAEVVLSPAGDCDDLSIRVTQRLRASELSNKASIG
jgi:predicted amidohydrolase